MKAQTVEGEELLKKLENSLSPFEKFVAKSEIEEELPLVSNRKYFLDKVINILNYSNIKRIIPISADTGTGKTFFLHQIKSTLEIYAPSIFIEVPPNSEIFYYDIYTKIIEEVGVLRDITLQLADSWGATEKKYGLYHTSNILRVLDQAKKTARYRWSEHKSQLEECMIVIITHAIDPERSAIAERWLLGDIMNFDELFFLGVENNLSAKYMAEELLRIISDYLEDGINLMFDDIDKNWKRYDKYDFSDNGNLEDVQDQNNLEFFEQLEKLLFENKKIKLIITMNTDQRKEILSKFSNSSKNIIEEPITLLNFSTKDTQEYYVESLKYYCKKNNLSPIKELTSKFFPISKKLTLLIFEETLGNPREIIRRFQYVFDEIIFSETPVEEIEKEFMEKLKKKRMHLKAEKKNI